MNLNLPLWKDASPRQKRLYSMIFVLLLAIVATVAGALTPVDSQYAHMVSDQLNQTIAEGTATGMLAPSIFLNNFLLCLAMFIPLAGLPLGLFIMYNTGLAFSSVFQLQGASAASNATATAASIQPATAVLALVLMGLTFLCEYVSYSIGMSESIWLYRRISQQRWRELKITAILIGAVALLLTVGAIVETWAISLPL